MGTEKNLQLGVYLLDTVLLTAFIIGFHKLMCHIAPESVDNIENIPWVVLVYIIGFSFSYVLFPSLIQLRLIKYEDIIKRVTSTCFMMLLLFRLSFSYQNPLQIFLARSYSIPCWHISSLC